MVRVVVQGGATLKSPTRPSPSGPPSHTRSVRVGGRRGALERVQRGLTALGLSGRVVGEARQGLQADRVEALAEQVPRASRAVVVAQEGQPLMSLGQVAVVQVGRAMLERQGHPAPVLQLVVEAVAVVQVGVERPTRVGLRLRPLQEGLAE